MMTTRSFLQPIRTRRIVPTAVISLDDCAGHVPSLTPGTRDTLAAIGALWVSFATSASSMIPASASSRTPGCANS